MPLGICTYCRKQDQVSSLSGSPCTHRFCSLCLVRLLQMAAHIEDCSDTLLCCPVCMPATFRSCCAEIVEAHARARTRADQLESDLNKARNDLAAISDLGMFAAHALARDNDEETCLSGLRGARPPVLLTGVVRATRTPATPDVEALHTIAVELRTHETREKFARGAPEDAVEPALARQAVEQLAAVVAAAVAVPAASRGAEGVQQAARTASAVLRGLYDLLGHVSVVSRETDVVEKLVEYVNSSWRIERHSPILSSALTVLACLHYTASPDPLALCSELQTLPGQLQSAAAFYICVAAPHAAQLAAKVARAGLPTLALSHIRRGTGAACDLAALVALAALGVSNGGAGEDGGMLAASMNLGVVRDANNALINSKPDSTECYAASLVFCAATTITDTLLPPAGLARAIVALSRHGGDLAASACTAVLDAASRNGVGAVDAGAVGVGLPDLVSVLTGGFAGMFSPETTAAAVEWAAGAFVAAVNEVAASAGESGVELALGVTGNVAACTPVGRLVSMATSRLIGLAADQPTPKDAPPLRISVCKDIITTCISISRSLGAVLDTALVAEARTIALAVSLATDGLVSTLTPAGETALACVLRFCSRTLTLGRPASADTLIATLVDAGMLSPVSGHAVAAARLVRLIKRDVATSPQSAVQSVISGTAPTGPAAELAAAALALAAAMPPSSLLLGMRGGLLGAAVSLIRPAPTPPEIAEGACRIVLRACQLTDCAGEAAWVGEAWRLGAAQGAARLAAATNNTRVMLESVRLLAVLCSGRLAAGSPEWPVQMDFPWFAELLRVTSEGGISKQVSEDVARIRQACLAVPEWAQKRADAAVQALLMTKQAGAAGLVEAEMLNLAASGVLQPRHSRLLTQNI